MTVTKDLGHWRDLTGLNLTSLNLNDYLGFIYRMRNRKTGQVYIGRKQLWNKRGKNWYESDWKTYTSSSNQVNELLQSVPFDYEILAVFRTKSAIRYAEAAAIIYSGGYENPDRGYNGNFSGCRGRIKFDGTDAAQLSHLKRIVHEDTTT